MELTNLSTGSAAFDSWLNENDLIDKGFDSLGLLHRWQGTGTERHGYHQSYRH